MIGVTDMILIIDDENDLDFFERLYVKHHALMFGTAWKVFSDENIVREIVSDSCLALMEKVSTLCTMESVQLQVYIATTVFNHARNYWKQQKRKNKHVDYDASNNLENIADQFNLEKYIEAKEKAAETVRMIDQLPHRVRQAMKLKYEDELCDADIAKQMGISKNSVRKYISRGKEMLEKKLSGDEDNEWI